MTMPQQPFNFGQQWPDPSWPQQPTAPHHVIPADAKQPPRVSRDSVVARAALVAALASVAIVALFYAQHPATEVSKLRHQVNTLTQQVNTLSRQHQRDTLMVGTLNNQVGTLSTKVNGMGPTVHNLTQFANGVCSSALQGAKGPFTASFPCKTG